MAGPVEHRRIDPRHFREPVERKVPGQCVRPFVAEHLDGLRLTKIAVELDHEPLIPPKALAQDRFREPGSSNDHGKGWRTSIPKARQNRLKLAPARAVHEGVGARGTGVAIRSAGQGSAVTAEHRSRPLYGLRARLCVRRSGACAASFHPPSLALSLTRATPLCENTGTHTTLEPHATIE